jgi:hypothetical protein
VRPTPGRRHAVISACCVPTADTTSVGSFLSHHAGLSCLLCWSVILFECLGPFLVLSGRNGVVIFITLALAFHLGVAIVMGLNIFVWSFVAAYPAIIFMAEHLDMTRVLLRLLE